MLKVEEALTIIINSVPQLNVEKVSLTNSLGRILAEDISSQCDIPALDNSAMDGYALKSSDTKGASSGTPKILEVIDELKAGMISSSEIKQGQAIKIMTGAPIPRGADSVIMVEDTEKLEVRGRRSEVRSQK